MPTVAGKPGEDRFRLHQQHHIREHRQENPISRALVRVAQHGNPHEPVCPDDDVYQVPVGSSHFDQEMLFRGGSIHAFSNQATPQG